ncbi:MAG: Rieske (2Fe-2S) protein [Acidimicrobiales bacterium]
MTETQTKHRLCAVDDLSPDTARRFDIGKLRIALVRCGDDFYAIGDRCTHADVSLAEGDVYCQERELECWKHGSTFSLVTGEPQSLPATKPTPVYEVEIVDGDVVVTLP